MAVIVQKYGGTSVADTEKIKNVARRVVEARKAGYDTVAVVSALGKTTDELLEMAYRLNDSPSEREIDVLVSTGEQISVALLAMAIHNLGFEAISFTGPQIGILTDGSYTRARIVDIKPSRIKEQLSHGKIVIVAGFQGISKNSDITTLGRGGSDLTAIAMGAVLGAEVVEIYTDVEGVYSADPRVVPDARKLQVISYDEMLELSSLGAQVMQARSVEFAKRFNVPVHVRSSAGGNAGTLIREEARSMENIAVRGVASNRKEAKVTIFGVPDEPGIAAKIFKKLAAENINIDMIVQGVGEDKKSDISFTVSEEDLPRTRKAVDKIVKDTGARDSTADSGVAKVSVVGLGMRSHSGIASKMFQALAAENINIEMISTSEIKVSCIIKQESADRAVRALHKKFGLAKQGRARKKTSS